MSTPERLPTIPRWLRVFFLWFSALCFAATLVCGVFVLGFAHWRSWRAYCAGLSQAQSPSVAHLGFWVLTTFGTRSDKGFILEALHSADRKVRIKAIDWLEHRLGPEAEPEITVSLLDQDKYVVVAALRALSRLKTAKVYPVMLSLTHPWPRVRRQAARTLGHLGDPEAVAALRRALKDPHPWVRRDAIRALGKIKNARAAAALVELLACRGWHFQEAKGALKALGVGAKEALIGAASSGNRRIQLESLTLLDRLDQDLVQSLRAEMRQRSGGPLPMGIVRPGHREYVQARKAYQGGEYAEALDWLQLALKRDPCYAEALVLRGETLEEIGRPGEAFEAYQNAFLVETGEIDFLRRMGRIAQDQNWQSRLEEVYQLAVEFFPAQAQQWKGREDFLWK